MSDTSKPKRRRHVPVPKASHIYWSETAKGKTFEVRHPAGADGRRLYEVVGPRLDQAKSRAREIYGDTAPQVTSVGTTLNEVIANWRDVRELRPASEEGFDRALRLHVIPRFGRVKVKDIDRNAITLWLASLKRLDGKDGPLASGTKRQILVVLKIVLAHGVEIGAIGAVPKLDRKRTPKPSEPRRRVLSGAEEADLLKASIGWLKPLVTVTLHQALRLGEAAGLSWEDVSFADNKLTVRHSLGRDGKLGPPKGGKAVTIDLTPRAREALLALRAASDGTGLIFRNTTGGHLWHREVQRSFGTARARAHLEVTDDGPVVFHSLRHTGISRLANHPQIPLVAVRDFARHANLATTQSYIHLIENETVTAAIAEALAS